MKFFILRNLVALYAAFSWISSGAQNVEFVQSGSNNAHGNVSTGNDGEYYVQGKFNDYTMADSLDIDFNITRENWLLTPAGANYIAKYSSNDSLEWYCILSGVNATASGPFIQIDIDADTAGNIVVVVNSQEGQLFINGDSVASCNFDYSILLTLSRDSGAILDFFQFDSSQYTFIKEVMISSTNKKIINLNTSNSINISMSPLDTVLAPSGEKVIVYNELDSVLWYVRPGTSRPRSRTSFFCVDSFDKIYINYYHGYTENVVFTSFNGATQTEYLNEKAIVCYDSNGNIRFINKSNEGVVSFCDEELIDNHIITLVGWLAYGGSIECTDTTIVMPCLGTYDGFIMQIDTSGAYVRHEMITNQNYAALYKVTHDKYNNIYTCGRFKGTLNIGFGSTLPSATLAGSSTVRGMILKYGEELKFCDAFDIQDANSIRFLEINKDNHILFGGRVLGLRADFQRGTSTFYADPADQFSGNFIGAFSFGDDTRDTMDRVVCDQFVRYGKVYDSSGVYVDTTSNDFKFNYTQINLVVNSSNFEFIVEEHCDSAVINDSTYYNSGFYSQLLTTTEGCDSTLKILLTVNLPKDTTLIIDACNYYVHDGDTIEQNDTITEKYLTAKQCDSTVYHIFKIHHPDTSYVRDSGCLGVNLNGIIYSRSGEYFQTMTNSRGCDSVIVLNVIAYNRDTTFIDTISCRSIDINGQTISNAGIYYFTYTNYLGCDSNVVLNFTKTSDTVNITDTFCGVFKFRDTVFTASGSYIYNTKNVGYCDTVFKVNLVKTSIITKILLSKDTLFTANTGLYYTWLDCNSGTVLKTDSSNYLVLSDNGSYQVKIDSLGCLDSSSCLEVSTLNLDRHFNDFLIYPNPAEDKIYIKSAATEILGVEVIDNLGRDVSSQVDSIIKPEKYTLLLESLPKGTYSLFIRTSLGTYKTQIIKI